MASTRKPTGNPFEQAAADPARAAEQAASLSRGLSDTAQQIWLAGLGAFARAQAESTKLFEGLVREGLSLEQSALKYADTQAEVVRGAVESTVDSATARAAGTLGQLESAVEGGVRRALTRLGVPDREDIAELSRRVESLSEQLRSQRGNSTAAPARRPSPAKKAASRRAAAGSTTKPAKKASSSSARKPAGTKRK